jgi:myo-inositol-1(or 4)-monophosphatase
MLGTRESDRKVKEHQHLLDAARAAAAGAAAHIRAAPRPDPAAWSLKGPSDFVTGVDRDCEALIADILHRRFPDSAVLGEELTPHGSSEGLTWVVDPIDGTTNYLHGYPAYAVSIAAATGDRIVAAVVLDVARDVLYHATVGGGAWCGERRLAVSPIAEPRQALIGTGYPFKALHLLPTYLKQFAYILGNTSGIRRAGAASLDLVDIALGRFDGFWELELAPWDVAAGALIVREAGGLVTDGAGNDRILRHGVFVAGNPAMHDWLCRALRESGG